MNLNGVDFSAVCHIVCDGFPLCLIHRAKKNKDEKTLNILTKNFEKHGHVGKKSIFSSLTLTEMKKQIIARFTR